MAEILFKSDINLGTDSKITGAQTVNKITITTPATGATLTIADGFTLSAPANATVSGTNTGDQTITLTGDITGSGTGSFATAIAAGAIVNADINAAAAIDLSKLAEAVIQADGGQAFTANQPMGGFKFTGAADPTSAQEFATKAYTDSLIDGRSWKQSVKAATTSALTLATDFENGDTIDGYTLVTNDRVLNKDAASAAENGIYIVQASGAPVRATDADAASELVGAAIFVEQGTVNGDKQFAQTGDGGTFAINSVWVVTSANSFSGHDMIALSGGQISVDLATASGLESSNPGNAAGQLQIKLDGTTLSKSASGLRVSTTTIQTITDAQQDIDDHIADATDAHDASAISNVPAGNIAATDVQAAINELDSEKQVTLVSGTNIKTINSTSLLGAGDIAITGNATHTGEVTGATVLTVDKTAITNRTAVTAASGDYVLISDVSDSDNLKKALVSDFGKRFSSTFGDNSAVNFTIAHGLGTADLTAIVRKISDGAIIATSMEIDSTNVVLHFNTAPTTSQYKVTLIG